MADALSLAEDFTGEQPFVVALGDSIICDVEMGGLLRRMIQEHLDKDAAATIAVESVSPASVPNHDIVCPVEGTKPADDVFDVADVVERPTA